MQYLLLLLIIHFLADFALQTHEQAIGKSEGSSILNAQLSFHVSIYSIVMSLSLYAIGFSFLLALKFWSITYLSHYITDYCTSRIGKPYWAKNDFHNGFVVVGADQLLHFIQIYYTLHYISNI